jgi:hypothetical protein
MMNSCEILIHNMKDDEEMVSVQNALAENGLTDRGDEDMPMFLKWGKPRSVYVDPSEVGKAVKIINGLGYETDEDEEQES